VICEFFELSKSSFDSLSDEEQSALNALAQDKSIVIHKADKGWFLLMNTWIMQNLSIKYFLYLTAKSIIYVDSGVVVTVPEIFDFF